MSGRIFPLGLILCVAAAPIAGCSLTQKQTVDFAQFKAAKKPARSWTAVRAATELRT